MKNLMIGLLAAASAFPSMSAYAQSQTTEGTEATPAQQAGTPAPPPQSTIVVTGSRIARDGFNAPTPVNVLNTDELNKVAPSTLAEALDQLPVFQNSISGNKQQFALGNRQRTGNYLNLRALGAERVLVLLDGQRLAPTGTNGGVDASLVPQMLIQRVDVVTGGASAVYGSDAVSGVVNFVLDNRFEGVRVQGNVGTAQGGFRNSYRAGIAMGTSFLDDRLHLIASAERYHIDKVSKTNFPDIETAYIRGGAGTAEDPIRYIRDARLISRSEGGKVLDGPFAGLQFAPNGELVPFDTGMPSGVSGIQIGGDGSKTGQECCTIAPSQTANQLYARAELDMGVVTPFVAAGYNWAWSEDNNIPIGRNRITIFNDNAFLTDDQRAALAGTPSFGIGKQANDIEGGLARQESSSLMLMAGFQAQLGTLDLNVGYTHHKTTFDALNNNTENANFYAAVDAVDDGTGNIVCRVQLTNPGLYPDCVPINLFGAGNITAEADDYVRNESRFKGVNTLDSIQATLSGSLFDLPAGPVGFAVGGEYRTQTLVQTSNADPTIPVDYTGLRGVIQDLRFYFTNVGVAEGDYDVKEVFGELSVPVLAASSVGDLELSAAARLTDYSTSGTVTTWKLGGLYDPVPGVRVRATYSRDIRAPSLYELFAGQTAGVITFSDSLTNQQVTTQQIEGGNPDLQPETAKTFTAGIVLDSSLLPGFNFSADYFKISIDDAIAVPFSAFEIVEICNASGQTSRLCDAVIRPLGPSDPSPANAPTEVRVFNQNVASLDVAGIDFAASYAFDAGPGVVSLRAMGTRLLEYNQQNAPGQPIFEFAGTADLSDRQFPVPQPHWRGNVNVGFDTERFSANLQGRYIGGYKRSEILVFEENDIDPVFYTDANITYRFPSDFGEFEMFATVNNLFDTDYPLIAVSRTPGATVQTIRNTYDIIGRYFTFGVKAEF